MESTSQIRDLSIVAGGWSFSEVDQARLPGYVIAVNDSVVHLSRYDEVLTMDRRWAEYRHRWLLDPTKEVYLRANAARRFERPLHSYWHVYECDHTTDVMTPIIGQLNGPHSGAVALNRAYQLAPDRLWLFGFDMSLGPKGQEYWYPAYPWSKRKPMKLREWSRRFDVVAEQFAELGTEVTVVGHSRIPQWKHIKPGALPC